MITERKCNCGITHISHRNMCNSCRATEMMIARKIAKENPKEKKCIKCSNNFISNKTHNICQNCESKHNKERWLIYAKGINRNNKETVQKVKFYQDYNRLENEKRLLELCGGKNYKCNSCGFESDIKEAYDLHHTDQLLKTDIPAQLIRRANFKEIFYNEKLELICKSCHRKKHSGNTEMLYARLEKHGVYPVCAISNQKMKWNQLDFHHVDKSEKLFNISHKIKRKFTKNFFLEISKCVIINATSHVLIHKGKLSCPDPKYNFIDIDNLN